MNYGRVSWLAGQVDGAANALTGARQNLAGTDPLVAKAFGNLAGSASCHASFVAFVTGTVTGSGHLATTLGADADKITKIIGVFQRTDAESADELCAATRNTLNVYTTHVHSEGPFERGSPGDVERARQITMAADHMGRQPGSTIFTGDLNEKVDGNVNTQSSDAIRQIRDRLGYDDTGAGAPNGGKTSVNGTSRRIDYVFTSPDLVGGDGRVVDGGTSDHHGIVTDVGIPRGW